MKELSENYTDIDYLVLNTITNQIRYIVEFLNKAQEITNLITTIDSLNSYALTNKRATIEMADNIFTNNDFRDIIGRITFALKYKLKGKDHTGKTQSTRYEVFCEELAQALVAAPTQNTYIDPQITKNINGVRTEISEETLSAFFISNEWYLTVCLIKLNVAEISSILRDLKPTPKA